MEIASTANIDLYYVEEGVGGDIPAAPNFQRIRRKSHTLTQSSERTDSDEKIQGRHKAASRRGAASVSGDIVANVVHGAHDALIEAAFMGAWNSNALKTGEQSRVFSILEHHTDLDLWYRYSGCVINTLDLACPLKEKAEIKFGVIGNKMEEYTLPGDQTLVAANDNPFMTTLIGSLLVDGVSIGYATALNFSLSNGIESLYALFDKNAVSRSVDVIETKGSLDAYFPNPALLNKFLNDDESVLELSLSDGARTIGLKVPKATWVNGSKNASEKSVTTSLEFSAGYESGDQSEFVFSRSA